MNSWSRDAHRVLPPAVLLGSRSHFKQSSNWYGFLHNDTHAPMFLPIQSIALAIGSPEPPHLFTLKHFRSSPRLSSITFEWSMSMTSMAMAGLE